MGSRIAPKSAAVTVVAVGVLILLPTMFAVGGGGSSVQPEYNGLSQNESLSLFSRDVDDPTTSPVTPAYSAIVEGDNTESSLDFYREGDRTYNLPPTQAATWTENAFKELRQDQLSTDTSLYPENTELRQSAFIKDAHVTVFSVSPSTIVHRGTGTTRFITNSGTVRALADYRVDVPETTVSDGNGDNVIQKTVRWSISDISREETSLSIDGQQVDESSDQAAILEYGIRHRDVDTLSVETSIEVSLQKEVEVKRVVSEDDHDRTRPPWRRFGGDETSPDNETETEVETVTRTSLVTDSVTVRDPVPVELYELSDLSGIKADGKSTGKRLALHTRTPVAGYEIKRNAEDTQSFVQTPWKFYTARNLTWNRIKKGDSTGDTVESRLTVPVEIHAYPSDSGLGSRGIDISGSNNIRGEGGTRPAPSLPETVQVDVPSDSYTDYSRITARHPTVNTSEDIRVVGLVRDYNRSLAWENLDSQEFHPVKLSLTTIAGSSDRTTLRVELRDKTTGDPLPESANTIVTVSSGRQTKEVDVGSDGSTTVTFQSFGSFSAEYSPTDWINVQSGPAYEADSASARQVPIASVWGWIAILIDVLQWFWWLFVAVFLGRKVGSNLRSADLA